MPTRNLPSGEKVLLLTLGSTPQVVTETIYALAKGEPAWIPDRIILATTDYGQRLFNEGRPAGDRNPIAPLLGSDGMLARMIAACNFPISLDQVEVVVPRCQNGVPIIDIRDAEETLAFAEALLAIVSEVTSDPASQLHVSLAGGRKTMSFVAGQVLSILGRQHDHLSHVLIEPRELEWQDSFWWPDDSSAGSDGAKINLCIVPYLRARAWLDPAQVVQVSPGYSKAVEIANQSLGHVPVTLDLVAGHLEVCGVQIELGAQQLATLALIFIATKRGLPLTTTTDWRSDDRKARAFKLGEDIDGANQLWGFFYHCCILGQIYEGGPVVHFGPFDSALTRYLDDFSYNDRVASPLSRMRQELSEELPPALAEKIITPRGLATLIEPADITILGPADLADHEMWPIELDHC
ncbi:MAG: TIGR02584 family CRISPR-associated protein [Porphyrobacter sp. IPPAS B-1204]|nr:MAG: TIGR02584 family CRISPR-associated protein [Porphyrobacter sp. IPPAS B-1204]